LTVRISLHKNTDSLTLGASESIAVSRRHWHARHRSSSSEVDRNAADDVVKIATALAWPITALLEGGKWKLEKHGVVTLRAAHRKAAAQQRP